MVVLIQKLVTVLLIVVVTILYKHFEDQQKHPDR